MLWSYSYWIITKSISQISQFLGLFVPPSLTLDPFPLCIDFESYLWTKIVFIEGRKYETCITDKSELVSRLHLNFRLSRTKCLEGLKFRTFPNFSNYNYILTRTPAHYSQISIFPLSNFTPLLFTSTYCSYFPFHYWYVIFYRHFPLLAFIIQLH